MLKISGFVLGWLATGCIGVPAAPAGSGNGATPGAPAAAAIPSCPKGTRPADDGLIDDVEDGDTNVLNIAGRNGTWWKHADPFGTAFDPDELKVAEPGADGTGKAIHGKGRTGGGNDAYGASIGANLSSAGAYDASTYVGISFKAKMDAGSSHQVRFKIGDVNTHQDGKKCKNCWNHFGKDFVIGEEWKEYVVTFAEARQVPGWGDPRPSAITPAELFNLDWTITTKGADFGMWLDDVTFLVCK